MKRMLCVLADRGVTKRRLLLSIIARATVLISLQFISPAAAQTPAAAPSAQRLPNGHPDLSGVWMGCSIATSLEPTA